MAPLLGLLAGALLSVSPISWPTIPAVMAVVTPAERIGTLPNLPADPEEAAEPLTRLRAGLVVLGFVLGMDGVIATLGAVLVSLTYVLTRAALALSIVAGLLLAFAGARLVLRRGSLCTRTARLPPSPLRAVPAGAAFAVVGCPGCAPVAIGIGGAAAASSNPLLPPLVIGGFVLGRAIVLYLAGLAGGRLLGTGTPTAWRRFDLIVGGLLLVAGTYYLLRAGLGAVPTRLPGTPGGPLG